MRITKLRALDVSGIEHEFEGLGSLHLYGIGPDTILTVRAGLKLGVTNAVQESSAEKIPIQQISSNRETLGKDDNSEVTGEEE